MLSFVILGLANAACLEAAQTKPPSLIAALPLGGLKTREAYLPSARQAESDKPVVMLRWALVLN